MTSRSKWLFDSNETPIPESEPGRVLEGVDARRFDAKMAWLGGFNPFLRADAVSLWRMLEKGPGRYRAIAMTDDEIITLLCGTARYGLYRTVTSPTIATHKDTILQFILDEIAVRQHKVLSYERFASHARLATIAGETLREVTRVSSLPRDYWKLRARCPFCDGVIFIELETHSWVTPCCEMRGHMWDFVIAAFQNIVADTWFGRRGD